MLHGMVPELSVPAIAKRARDCAGLSAFFWYVHTHMPGTITSLDDYIPFLVWPDSDEAQCSYSAMKQNASRCGYADIFEETLAKAKERKGVVLAFGSDTLNAYWYSCSAYHLSERIMKNEVFIVTREGMGLDAIAGVEFFSEEEKRELHLSLTPRL